MYNYSRLQEQVTIETVVLLSYCGLHIYTLIIYQLSYRNMPFITKLKLVKLNHCINPSICIFIVMCILATSGITAYIFKNYNTAAHY